MSIQSYASTAASISAVFVFLGVLGRWIHRWFARLEHAVNVVEQRSQQLEPNGGSSLRDDVTAIRRALDQHAADLARLHTQVDTLSKPNGGGPE
jgi:hypothetical protein